MTRSPATRPPTLRPEEAAERRNHLTVHIPVRLMFIVPILTIIPGALLRDELPTHFHQTRTAGYCKRMPNANTTANRKDRTMPKFDRIRRYSSVTLKRGRWTQG